MISPISGVSIIILLLKLIKLIIFVNNIIYIVLDKLSFYSI